MDAVIFVVSPHPLVPLFIGRILSTCTELRQCQVVCGDLKTLAPQQRPLLFLIDTCSGAIDITDFCRITRTRFAGSKFIALLEPGKYNDEELIRLLHLGFDGVLATATHFEKELPRAVCSIMNGKLWVPRSVEQRFASQVKWIVDSQVWPAHSLTAREAQVFQLLIRRFSNKEISSALGITERTAKFHVSNVLDKTGVGSRRSFLALPEMMSATSIAPGQKYENYYARA